MNVLDFTVKNNQGNQVKLSEYKGKVLLIVNTATECGFTPQYEELQNLYEKYNARGLEILDFPCNQFGNQAPGTDKEIAAFCTSRFGVSFPIFAKIKVNGEEADPLFTYLQNQKPFAGFDPVHKLTNILNNILGKEDKEFASKPDIKWNFTKFLIDKNGEVVERFEPTKAVDEIASKIESLL